MEALRRNRYVEVLILQENFLTPEDCEYLNEMFMINTTIKYVNMRNCQIGADGAAKLIDFIQATPVVDLDFSFNSIGNDGLNTLGEAFMINQSFKKLNLSRNNLGEDCCKTLAKIVEANDYIEDLNLSWNEIYTPTGIAFKVQSTARFFKRFCF